MLSDSDVEAMRDEIGLTLTDTATIKRATRTSDGAGGFIETWADAATVPCRLIVGIRGERSEGQRERHIADRVSVGGMAEIVLPCGTDVRMTDRLAIGGVEYEVVVIQAGTLELARRVLAVRRA